ncbi:uncharacterized protein TRIADDRAFT_60144 [Trichoplax adhaerens]|uniref:FAM192A/Fyv6 N-terminal domain-containing protein n=1 Tax=Trichoplax adhaerens TaxID=10228 RepID=B3S7F2_TRIAD|nr:hypothetical protein TRIADDRAFT_60144 [Trichoplax adhaerens]EDV21279.1 hypothetical protein TRIADDRAFT_60144 [Trichoplax adhaerens]|eukprot:XP_002116246.1 hypothetical protein TRIADDRAFT_60144 [Trichoplax adhaerens]
MSYFSQEGMNASTKGQLKSFVTETELEDLRRQREEEWKKVKDESSKSVIDRPEELTDRRSLYEQLQEQKTKKQEEWDEQFKFKNMIRGLDDDEADFLDNSNQLQADLETLINVYEAVSSLASKEVDNKPIVETHKSYPPEIIKNNKKTQSQLLSGLVRQRKRSFEEKESKPIDSDTRQSDAKKIKPTTTSSPPDETAIAIPGIGVYSDSSSSEEND